jgi:hypothetical protein
LPAPLCALSLSLLPIYRRSRPDAPSHAISDRLFTALLQLFIARGVELLWPSPGQREHRMAYLIPISSSGRGAAKGPGRRRQQCREACWCVYI